jgi:small GTP-binding protein
MHFATSTVQYPEYALLGEPGRTQAITLELQLLADIALIGTPSVGKSTLINASSQAKAKTAAYHFTTLVPNLGMVSRYGQSFSMIDIPGLIEGAADGKGLGNEFLRHILKAHIWCFVHDVAEYERGMRDSTTLFDEIQTFITNKYEHNHDFAKKITDVSYSLETIDGHLHLKVWAQFDNEKMKHLLLDKMLLWVLNKYDLVQDEEIVHEYIQQLTEHLVGYFDTRFGLSVDAELIQRNVFVVSGATNYQIDHRLDKLSERLQSHEFVNEYTIERVEYDTDHESQSGSMYDVTDTVLPQLIADEYMEERDSRFVKIRRTDRADVIKAAFITMWGNDE